MWSPKAFHTKNKVLDLSSSGQQPLSVNELYADDIRISNGLELNNWDNELIQLIVCDYCATIQCNSGNWAVFRKAGDFILLTPAFHEMSEGYWELDEYNPPNFIKKLGAMYLTHDKYLGLKKLIPSIPDIENIKNLSLAETAWLIQWEAPFYALRKFPLSFDFIYDEFIGTNQQSDEKTIRLLIDLLNAAIKSNDLVELFPIPDESEIVSFFFDGYQFVEWIPMCLVGDSWNLVLKPGLQIIKI